MYIIVKDGTKVISSEKASQKSVSILKRDIKNFPKDEDFVREEIYICEKIKFVYIVTININTGCLIQYYTRFDDLFNYKNWSIDTLF